MDVPQGGGESRKKNRETHCEPKIVAAKVIPKILYSPFLLREGEYNYKDVGKVGVTGGKIKPCCIPCHHLTLPMFTCPLLWRMSGG